MAVLTVYGASDDLVEIDGIEGADEFSVPSDGHWSGVLTAPNGDTAILYVDYRDNGTWTVALGQWEEEYDLPEWAVKITVNKDLCRYSTYAEIVVPDGTKITVQD